MNDTREQTREIMLVAAEAVSGMGTKSPAATVDLAPWHALQEWLEGTERRVVVPFAPALAHLVPPTALRLRRDFTTLLTLVKVHAFLHQARRERDAEGRIVASLDDYAVVRPLIADVLADGIESSVPVSVRETVEAVRDLSKGRLNYPVKGYRTLGEHLGLDKTAVSRRVQDAIARGYLQNLEEKPGRPALLVLGEPLPEDRDVLPTVEVLAEAVRCCSVASVSGGKGEEASSTSSQTNLEVIEI